MRAESCGVSVVGTPFLRELGPTPVGAPFLANDLVTRLLARLPATVHEPTVRFSFDVPTLLTFSYELDALVLSRLASIAADCEFCINEYEPRFERFEAWRASAYLEAYTADRDPHPITAALGIEPTTVRRAGEPLEPGARPLSVGVWRFERDMTPPIDIDRMVRLHFENVGSDLPARCPDETVKVRLSLQVRRLRGGFRLRRGVVARLAELRVPLGCFFYNMGA
jgi:hypothetical protein